MRAPPPSWDDTTPAGAGAAGPLAGAVADKLRRLSASRGAAQADEAWRWIQALHEEDPECAQAVAERLDLLMARLSAGGLGRWVLAGLRRHERAPAAQRLFPAARSLCARGTAWRGRRARAGSLAGAAVVSADRPVAARDDGGATAPPVAVRSPSRPILTATHLLAPDSYGAGRRRPLGAVPRRRGARGRAACTRAPRNRRARSSRWRWPWCRRSRTRASSACCAPPFPARAAGSAPSCRRRRSRRPELRRAGAAGPRADGSGSGR